MNMKNNMDNISNIENEGFNIKNEISYYLFFWPWFLLTIVTALIGSYTYLRYTPNIYSSSAQVQITKSDASSSFLTTEVTSLFGTRVNVENDISVITSNYIIDKVVKSLDLQTNITKDGIVKSSLVYNENLPFKIRFKEPSRPQQWNLTFSGDLVSITNGISSFKLNRKDSIENDFFYLTTNNYNSNNNESYKISRLSLNNTTASIKARISTSANSKNGEIINLSISGTNTNRNDAILNTLIKVLIDDRITDQRQLSAATIDFIDKRLKILRKRIDSISKKTIEFQLKNNLYDTEKQTSNILSNIVNENEVAFNLEIQLEIATSLQNKKL
jgi:tyrosine-protein kinase Etk/Wzc